jgi:ankyrin repeat protein
LLASSISNRPPNCRRPKKKSIGEKCGLGEFSAHGDNVQIINEIINLGYTYEMDIEHGHYSIHFAAFYGNQEAVELYIKSGWPVSTLFRDKSNLIYQSIFSENINLIRYLINQGLDVNHKSQDSNVPLHLAAYMNNPTIVQLLTIT